LQAIKFGSISTRKDTNSKPVDGEVDVATMYPCHPAFAPEGILFAFLIIKNMRVPTSSEIIAGILREGVVEEAFVCPIDEIYWGIGFDAERDAGEGEAVAVQRQSRME
jgi:hypothetical protein